MSPLDRLLKLKLVVVTGKGGVGKSTVAATLGRTIARTSTRVLLLEVDAHESLYQLLGVPPTDGEITSAGPGLDLQNLRPRRVLDRLVRERVRIDLISQRVLSSPIYEHFVEGAPGLKELAVFGYALDKVRGEAGSDRPDADLVLLDAPATGHGVSLLAAPGLVSDVIREGPVGHLAQRLADFASDREQCGIVVTVQAEEMPVTETIELLDSLRERLDRRPELIVVNALYPALEDAGTSGLPEAVVDLWRLRRAANERELRRLRRHWTGPLVELPLTPRDRGPELVEALRVPLERELTRVGAPS